MMEIVTPESKLEGTNLDFYKDASKYWEGVPPTVEGMLGGFGHISHTDIQGSDSFLQSLFKMKGGPGKGTALDCGAGIGRITKHLLLKYFECVDLVEQNQEFLNVAKTYLPDYRKVGRMFCSGLQDFVLEPRRYDVVWCQWVLGHLTDEHLVQFFRRCSKSLKPGGVLVVKENMTSSGEVEVDVSDSSVTRPQSLWKLLMSQAGLTIVREEKQKRFPKELYDVKMFALRSADHGSF